MKIIILTSKTLGNIYLVNKLLNELNVVGKVIEQRPLAKKNDDKWAIRKKLFKKHGILKTINHLLYNKLILKSTVENEQTFYQNKLFDNKAPDYCKEIPTIVVPKINDQKTIEFIREHDPDVIAVCGTTIIRPKVFELAKKGTVNIHCGITPEYRSADPIFWALYNKEPDKVGVTIHFIDKGIDTGDIIYQELVKVTKKDSLISLNCKCVQTGAEMMIKAIKDIENEVVKPLKKEASESKAYYRIDRGLFQYLVFSHRFKKIINNLN